MKCLICGSENIETKETIISDFVMARIDPGFESIHKNVETNICFCKDCTFAFYEYRFTPQEEALLYRNYRDGEYQQLREKYECWYTKKVNDEINRGYVIGQQSIIRKVLLSCVPLDFDTALDYGGNQGATFFDKIGTKRRIVYDISGVHTLPGVIGITDYHELLNYTYDFIMCNMVFEHLVDPYEVLRRLFKLGNADTIYYIEVPSENPFTEGNKFSLKKNISLLMNRNYSWYRLVKYYIQQRHQPFMPMKEHINFFTKQSLSILAEKGGFSVLEIQENPLGNSTVLSMVFKKRLHT